MSENIEAVKKSLGIWSQQEKEHREALACLVMSRLGWHEGPGGFSYFGLPPRDTFGSEDEGGDILAALGCKMKGDDGHGPCWSSDQRAYAQHLLSGLGASMQSFPKLLEFYKEGYADADGIAYDYGVPRERGGLREAVRKHRYAQDEKIRNLQGLIGGYRIPGIVKDLKQLAENLEGLQAAKEGKESK